MMKLLRIFSATVVVALIALTGCEKDSPMSADQSTTPIDADVLAQVSANGSEYSKVELIAAKTVDVGDVSFDDVDTDNDGTDDALVVTIESADGWKLVSTNLWIGPSLSDMPDTRKGDPKPRKFPYHSRRICDSIWTVTIPFEAIGYECGDTTTWYVAANAVVRKVSGHRKHRTESAWSGDTRFREKRGHWATYTTIVIDCDGPEEPPPPPPVVPHPAFAYGPDYLECNVTGGAGWTYFFIEATDVTYTLYADPTDCDTPGGTAVGTVTLSYDGGTSATVTFTTVGPYALNLASVSYGLDPGTFTQSQVLSGATTHTITLTNFEPFSYLSAQALVVGF